jgi:predicted nucleic acid-binding protein
MRKIMLDTNAYAAFKQGHEEVVAILQYADVIGISAIVLGELVAGFAVGTKTKENYDELNSFLNSSRIQILSIDEVTTSFYAQVYKTLRKKGKPIPTNDLWIASATLQHGYKLCTFDTHFKTIDNLMVATHLAEFLL